MIRLSSNIEKDEARRVPGSPGSAEDASHLQARQALLYGPEELVKSCSLSPGQLAEAAWSRRYSDAIKRYEGLDLCSHEAVRAVIGGLQDWARLAPQRSVGVDGAPEPANKWGLGAERCVLRALHSHLVAIGQPVLAARIHSETADLMQTADSLDECCMRVPPNPHAEKRLVATARVQTKALVKLLSTIRLPSALSADGPLPRRRRGAPRRRDPTGDRRLMEEWAVVRGRAGMTRKEFCLRKGISMLDFVQAQDRVRKQSAAPAAVPA